MKNGKKTRFWFDVWALECPLKIAFHRLFDICRQQNWTVFQVLDEGDINLSFRRNFGDEEAIEWEELLDLIEGTVLTRESDTAVWALEKSGDFYDFIFIQRIASSSPASPTNT